MLACLLDLPEPAFCLLPSHHGLLSLPLHLHVMSSLTLFLYTCSWQVSRQPLPFMFHCPRLPCSCVKVLLNYILAFSSWGQVKYHSPIRIASGDRHVAWPGKQGWHNIIIIVRYRVTFLSGTWMFPFLFLPCVGFWIELPFFLPEHTLMPSQTELTPHLGFPFPHRTWPPLILEVNSGID